MGDSTLYLVRVWSDGGFRAAVRAVDSEQVELFDAADALARYLDRTARCGEHELRDDETGEPR